MVTHMRRVQVQLTDDQAGALRRSADVHGVTVAALVRQAVDAWIAGEERARRVERALAAIGGFRSGLGDLSERHDDYLADTRP
jgi:hypothetical protein